MSKFFYREIGESEVDPLKVKEANGVLEFCKDLLNLPDIRIRWCVKVEKEYFERSCSGVFGEIIKSLAGFNGHKEEFWGLVKVISQKDEILIRADIPLVKIKESIAHECKHHRDFRDYGFFNTNEEEKRAEGFAREIMKKMEMQ